MRFKRPAAP